MFSLFIVLISFSIFLACNQTNVFLNYEQSMVRHTLIHINPVELKYYSFMISLRKCTGSCNILSPRISVPKETKDINIKAFNMITNKSNME